MLKSEFETYLHLPFYSHAEIASNSLYFTLFPSLLAIPYL